MAQECTILIVDDDAAIRLALHDFLAQNGFPHVIAAANGSEGLALAREHRPRLIISDITMPTMDGYAFIQELRNDSALKAVPVIVLTGREEMVDLFKMAEIYNYLFKPVEPRMLLQMIDKVLRKTQDIQAHGSENLLNKIEKVEAMLTKKSSKHRKTKPLFQAVRDILSDGGGNKGKPQE